MNGHKYINKLVINDKFGFGLYAGSIVTGVMLLVGIAFFDLEKYSIFIIGTLVIIGTFNTINGIIGARECASFKKTNVPLSDAEKLHGDYDD